MAKNALLWHLARVHAALGSHKITMVVVFVSTLQIDLANNCQMMTCVRIQTNVKVVIASVECALKERLIK